MPRASPSTTPTGCSVAARTRVPRAPPLAGSLVVWRTRWPRLGPREEPRGRGETAMSTATSITDAAAALRDQLVGDRRHFHRHPELGFQEVETAAYVAGRLRALGIETRTGVAGTGVVGLIRGSRAGRPVLLPADTDALPVQG